MNTIRIGKRLVGEGQPVYFIAEIGINHNGNPELAKQLIDLAADAGADAVKFQKRNLSTLYQRKIIDNLEEADKELQYIIPYLLECDLPEQVFYELAAYATEKNIQFLCTPWDHQSVDFLESLGLPAYKVASADLNNLLLLDYLAETKKPLILSTGMSQFYEIETTVKFLREKRVEFALLHCNSTYPAPFKDINLRFMEKLQEFGVPVGYSGHERGIATSTVAVALGACIIERHITMDRTMRGPDHAASLEPPGLRKQIRDIRVVEQALGSPQRIMSRGEMMNRMVLGKSLVAACQIKKGQTIERHMVSAMSPGFGVSPQRINELIGCIAKRDISPQEQFRESDIRDITQAVTSHLPMRWGPVVRYRDVNGIVQRFNPDVLEFHLTERDLCMNPKLDDFQQEAIVHCPEYFEGRLLDLCSQEESVRRWSVDVVKRVVEITHRMASYFVGTPKRPKIVIHSGGMSYDGFLTDTKPLTDALSRSMEELAGEEANLLLENLPPYPWYFGGQWYSNNFVDAQEIADFCEERNLKITYDISHAQLWCNYIGSDLTAHLQILKPYIAHIHVSDASGTDGEGLQIGEGMVNWSAVVPVLAELPAAIIPEVWLGHHHNGEGFAIAIERLTAYLSKAVDSGKID